MTSKSLFFDLMKEDLKRRLWAIVLTMLTFFFAYPVMAAVLISQKLTGISEMMEPARRLELANQFCVANYADWLSERGFTSFIMAVLALILAFSGFSYLFSSRKTEFYHSLPIRREKLFAVIAVNSILIAAIPKLIMSLLGALLIAFHTGHASVFAPILTGFAVHMAYFFLCYMTCVIAVMMTGNLFVGLMGSGVFFTLLPFTAMVFQLLCETYFSTYVDLGQTDAIAMRVSPFLWCFDLDDSVPVYLKAVIAVIAGLLFMLIAVRLYQKRPSEAAGRAMAFEKTKTPIKFIITVPTAVCGALIMYSIFGQDGWAVFGLIMTVLIGCCVIEILYHFNFRKLFANKHHIVLTGILAAAILSVFRFDLAGYDRYFPDLDQLTGAGIFSDSLESNIYQLDRDFYIEEDYYSDSTYIMSQDSGSNTDRVDAMEITDKDLIRTIAVKGVNSIDTSYSDDGQFRTVLVAYHQNNGRNVYRQYQIPADNEIVSALDQVHDSEEFKKAVYPVLSENREDIVGINYRTVTGVYSLPENDPEKIRKIFDTYCEEFLALKAADRRKENVNLNIQFKDIQLQELENQIHTKNSEGTEELNYAHYYPVYPSFKKTLALLDEYGVHAGNSFTAEDVSEAAVSDYRAYLNGEIPENSDWHHDEVITDKEQIGEILKSCCSQDFPYINSMRPYYTGLTVYIHIPSETQVQGTAVSGMGRVYTSDGYANECVMYFNTDCVPQFIRDKYDLQQKDIELESSAR